MHPKHILALVFASIIAACGTEPGPIIVIEPPQAQALAAGYSEIRAGGRCLDAATPVRAGGPVHLWDCGGQENQGWKFSGGFLRTAGGMCLDVRDGRAENGARLQVYSCGSGNKNQKWERVGQAYRFAGTSKCLDVAGGRFANGTAIQLWDCVQGSANQAFGDVDTSAPVVARNDGDRFYGYQAISIDRFCQLHTECAPFKNAFVAAAADQGLHPTFLAAIAETESSCRATPGNPWGMFQFSDDDAWRVYGLNKDRNNPWDSAFAAARYFKDLLRQTNGNLDQALRLYNGPISQGGNKNYQSEVRKWMNGGNPWG